VVAGSVVDVAWDAREALIPRRISGGDQLRTDVPFDRYRTGNAAGSV
jgi:hypothetical protein